MAITGFPFNTYRAYLLDVYDLIKPAKSRLTRGVTIGGVPAVPAHGELSGGVSSTWHFPDCLFYRSGRMSMADVDAILA